MSDESATATGTDGLSRVRIVGIVLGLSLLSTAAAAYEIAPASVFPTIQTSLSIGPATAGWLVSVMYLVSVLLSVPVGFGLDRTSTRLAITGAGLALLVAGAGSYVAATGGSFWWLIAARALGGLAYVVVWNAGANLVGQVVTPDLRATTVGVFTASAPVGFAMGQFGAPLVTDLLGWPAIFPVFAGIAAVGLVPFLLAGRGVSAGIETEMPDAAALTRLLANRRAWILYGLCFLAFSLYLFLNSWLPSYLTEELLVAPAVGGLVTALLPAVGILARTGSGLLSDRLFDGRRRPVVLIGFLVATPAVFGFLAVTQVAPIVGLIVVAGFGIQLNLGLVFSYVAEVVEPTVTSTAIATLTAAGLSGAMVAPIAGGAIIDAAGYPTAFLAAGVVAVVGVGLAWWAPEPGDE